MNDQTFYCPLLKREIRRSVCQKITYAAEGRISHAVVPDIENWTHAKEVCADCVNAYWNQNNMRYDA